jgi:SAM-dependent methyltransferase
MNSQDSSSNGKQRKKVYVAVPNQNWLHNGLVRQIINMVSSKTADAILEAQAQEVRENGKISEDLISRVFNYIDNRCDVIYDDTSEKPTDSCRNQIVKNFLECSAVPDFLLFIDSDNPPFYNPLPLVEKDKDIIACPTPIWYNKIAQGGVGAMPIIWNCFDYLPSRQGWREHAPRGGFQEIDSAGTGCLLIKRRVLENPDMRPPFRRGWDEYGIAKVGSDMLFCQRAKNLGFEVWADYDYPCMHFKSRDLVEIFQLMMARDLIHANEENPNCPGYWDERWTEDDDKAMWRTPAEVYEGMETMLEKIAKHLGRKIHVADVGCGDGEFLERLIDKDYIASATGVDYSKKAVVLTRNRLKGKCTVIHGDHSDVPREQDVITGVNVFQTMEDGPAVMRTLLSRASFLVYTVPDNCYPRGVVPSNVVLYNQRAVRRLTPHLKDLLVLENFVVALAHEGEGTWQESTPPQCSVKASRG